MSARSAAPSASALVVALALTLAGCGGGSDSPPPDDAARLVPRDALVFVHVSTDTGRGATSSADALARRFPGYLGARRSLVARLSAPGCKVDLGKGKEAALALLDSGGGSAGSLVLVDTGDDAAQRTRTCGAVRVAKIGRFVAIGQASSLAAAQRLHDAKDNAGSLARSTRYAALTKSLPADRVADAWVTHDGVQRLLAPQGGLLGIAGTLLNQPDLRAAAASLSADGDTRAKLVLRTLLTRRSGQTFQDFAPTLPAQVPAGATAFLGVRGITGAVARLLPLVASQTASLAPLLRRAGSDLAPLAALFRGEVGVTITSATPAPVLTISAPVADPAKASRTLASSRAIVARLLRSSGGATPRWREVGGAWQLRPAPGIEFDYAVLGKRVAVSTRLSGITALRRRFAPLASSDAFDAVQPGIPDRVSSLVFLDFNKLLSLGEKTGLDDSAEYRRVAADLKRIRGVGVRTSGDGDETTAELFLSIP